MTFGVVQYVMGKRHLAPAIERLSARSAPVKPAGSPEARQSVTAAEWTRIGAIVVFFLFATIFWGAYEQAASTLSLFGDRYTRHEVFGFRLPVLLVPDSCSLWP